MVAPDKLRFDFSFNRPVTPEELAKVESQVSEAIAANLQVFTEPTNLAKAKGITGVRAVFGETYPDPVRVVSIGRKVTDLFDDKGANATSAEFCGGTHVAATGAITAFAIISEEGVAKGVRRLTAVSGMAAKAGMIAGEQLMRRVQAASRLDGDGLSNEVKAILVDMEALTVPLRAKLAARQAITDLQEKLKQASKAAAGARASAVAADARSIASSSEWEMVPSIITTIDAGSDKDALAAAINTIRELRPKHAILLVSPDRDEGKLTIVASVPDALQKRGLKAGDWVKEAAAACGGRGGGRPDMAQGGGTDVTKIKETLAAARSYAFAKVPSM
jgi:alanyl-tRNA synthetase